MPHHSALAEASKWSSRADHIECFPEAQVGGHEDMNDHDDGTLV